MKFPSQRRKKILKSVKKQRNYARNNEIGLMWSGQSFGKVRYRISKSKKKKLLKSVKKQRNYALINKNAKIVMFNWTVVVRTVIWGKYNIGFWIPIKFPSQRKKNIEISQRNYALIKNAKIIMFKMDVRTSRYCL